MRKGEPDQGLEEEEVGDNRLIERKDLERGTWTNPCDFFISCLGYAVGLGKDWTRLVIITKYFCCRKCLAVSILVFQARRWFFPNTVFPDVIPGRTASVFIGGRSTPLSSSH